MIRSAATAALIALAIQIFTVGILAPRLPREVCRPGAQSERTFELPTAGVLRLVNLDGAVRLQTSDAAEQVLVAARIRAYADGAEALQEAEAYLESLFAVEHSPELLSIVTEPLQRPDSVDLRVDYALTMPPGMDAAVDVANGNVWIAAGFNNISVEGNNSDIEVVAPMGALSVKTINGRIRALECALETTLETVNGSIAVSLKSGALQASTVTGAITATLLDDPVTACDLTSLNGSITLVMSDHHSAEINAGTARGVVRADFPLSPARGVQKRRMISGVFGSGDTALSVNSMNGDIVIQRNAT